MSGWKSEEVMILCLGPGILGSDPGLCQSKDAGESA